MLRTIAPLPQSTISILARAGGKSISRSLDSGESKQFTDPIEHTGSSQSRPADSEPSRNETLAQDLQERLLKARTAAEMSLAFDEIRGQAHWLHAHPQLLLALADHGVRMARDDASLLKSIAVFCLYHAEKQQEPARTWSSLARCVDHLPLASAQAVAEAMACFQSSMPNEAASSHTHVLKTIELKKGSAPQPAHDPLTAQPVQTPITSSPDTVRHAGLVRKARSLFEQLAGNRVRSAQQWDKFLPQLDKELLQMSPALRNELVTQILRSPDATLAQAEAVARVCLDVDTFKDQTHKAWDSFSRAILRGGLPLPLAQKLMDCMNAAKHPCPPELAQLFKEAQDSLARQFEPAKV